MGIPGKSFESFLADPTAVRDRGEWYCELYLKNPLGVEEILRFSRRGIFTVDEMVAPDGDVIPAHTAYRKRILTVPTLTQSMWKEGSILSSSLPTYGQFTLRNGDRGLDRYRPAEGYKWNGCRCKWFFFDPLYPTTTVGKVFDGYMGDPSFSLKEPVSVPVYGREKVFDQPTSRRVYRGTSYMYEMGTGSRTITYGGSAAGAAAPLNITGNLTLERWLYIETANTGAIQPWWGWNGASPWRTVIGATRTFGLFVTISGATQSKTSTFTFSTGKWYHIACVISGRDVIFYFWNEDDQILTTESYPLAFTSSTRDAAAGGIVNIETTATDATFRYWVDDSRVWNVARTLDQITANRHKPFKAGSIPSSLKHYVRYDDGAGAPTDSSASAAHGVLTGAGASQYLWAMEGGSDLAGTPKPDVSGKRFGVRPQLIDPVRNVYQVAGAGGIQSTTPFEGGAAYAGGITNQSNYRTFVLPTTVPAAGAVITHLSRGMFKLPATPPTLPVSATVEGYNGGSLGYVNKGTTIVRDWITRRGPKLTDPTSLDTSSFSFYPTEKVMGVAVYTPKPLRELLDYCMKGSTGWWGYVRSSILFHVQKFTGPGSIDYSFDQRRIIDVVELPSTRTIWSVIVRYRPNDVVLQEDQVAASVKGAEGWTQWTLPYLETPPAQDESLRVEDSEPLIVETGLYEEEDAIALAEELLSLLKGAHFPYRVTLNTIGAQSSIGESEAITFIRQNGQEVMSLDGDVHVILSTIDNWQAGTIVHEIWR